MPSLWFITPAWRRLELSEICFDQRRLLCDELRRRFSIDATCVVVADDENLELARARGFETVERDNTWLGRRFNDGYEAAALAGADYVFAIGSDSWAAAEYFDQLPGADEVLTSSRVSSFRSDGRARRDLEVVYATGGAAMIVPTRLYAAVAFRPCKEKIRRGCESATWRRPLRGVPRVWRDGRVGELVNFLTETQVTPWTEVAKWTVATERADPFGVLRDLYPAELVRRIEAFYGSTVGRASNSSSGASKCGRVPRPAI